MKVSPVLTLSGLVLALGVMLALMGARDDESRHFKGGLRKLLSPTPSGWEAKECPMADTEEMRRAVGVILNYDEGILMRYIRGTTRLDVYVAYWSPGKMNYREVASHTPDVCWVAAGWERTAISHLESITVGKRKLFEGEARTFVLNGNVEYVWFWHVIDDRVHSYHTGGLPAWYSTFTDIISWGLDQRKEQFFIRISANQPLEALLAEELLPSILDRLPIPRAG